MTTTTGDELRERAQTLRDNPTAWVNSEPSRQGTRCAAFDMQHNGFSVQRLSTKTVEAVQEWLPSYIRTAYPEFWSQIMVTTRRDVPIYSLTEFNDSIAGDVWDVVTMLEKAAADIG